MTKIIDIPKRRSNDAYVRSSGTLPMAQVRIDVTTKKRLTDLSLKWNVEVSFLIRTCLEMLESGVAERELIIKGEAIVDKSSRTGMIENYRFRNGDKWETGRYNEDLANDWQEYLRVIKAYARKYKESLTLLSQIYICITTHEPNYTHLNKEQFTELFCKYLKKVTTNNYFNKKGTREFPLSSLSEAQEEYLRRNT